MALLVTNAHIVDPAQKLDASGALLVVDGTVAALGPQAAADPRATGAEVVDAQDQYLFPGLVDIHVHFREPGQTAKETIATGAQAAVAGGFTTVCAMANTKPVNDSVAITELMLNRAAKADLCRYFPIGALTRGLEGEELADYGTLVQAGCVAFSDDGKGVMNAEIMRKALQYTQWVGAPIIAHEEDKNLAGKGYMHEGAVSAGLGCHGIPAESEEVMVARDLVLVRHTGARLHFAHISTKGALAMIRAAKREGLPVTCEVCPHHFALTDAEMMRFDSDYKMNPPLRSQADLDALLEAIADGTVDAIATDHAPHSWDDKEVELPYAAFGIIGLETALPLTLELLVNRKVIDLPKAIELLTIGPARTLNLDRKGLGTLAVGNPADFTLVDLNDRITVDRAFIQSKSFNTPFKGWTLPGRIQGTWVAGRRVWGA